jgi:hypothetical protein
MRNLRSIITNQEMIRPLSRAPRSSVVIPASTTSHHAFVDDRDLSLSSGEIARR